MDLFLSTFENKIDRKGRLSVPAKYRLVFDRSNSPLFLFKSLTKSCLEGCGEERINQIVDAIDQMDLLSQDSLTLQTILSSTQEMKFDNEGRILLSEDFINYADLGNIALFSGIGRSFEIWNPELWHPRDTLTRDSAKNGKVPKLTFSRNTSQGNL